MKQRTTQELLDAAKRAEQRARDLRRQAAQRTRAEEARLNAEIVRAVKIWADERGMSYDALPDYFSRETQRQGRFDDADASQGVQGDFPLPQ